jgi:hypothetical protein
MSVPTKAPTLSELVGRLEELREKATPGPWHQAGRCLTQDTGITIVDCLSRGTETPSPESNAALIMDAVNAIPALSALLAEGKRLVEELRKEAYVDTYGYSKEAHHVRWKSFKYCADKLERWLGIAQEQGREA